MRSALPTHVPPNLRERARSRSVFSPRSRPTFIHSTHHDPSSSSHPPSPPSVARRPRVRARPPSPSPSGFLHHHHPRSFLARDRARSRSRASRRVIARRAHALVHVPIVPSHASARARDGDARRGTSPSRGRAGRGFCRRASRARHRRRRGDSARHHLHRRVGGRGSRRVGDCGVGVESMMGRWDGIIALDLFRKGACLDSVTYGKRRGSRARRMGGRVHERGRRDDIDDARARDTRRRAPRRGARANGRRPRSRPRSSACARRSRLRGRGADPRWRPFVSPRAWGGGRARERERAAIARGGDVDSVVRRLCASRGSGGRGANARASSREGRRRGCRGASRGRNDGRRVRA